MCTNEKNEITVNLRNCFVLPEMKKKMKSNTGCSEINCYKTLPLFSLSHTHTHNHTSLTGLTVHSQYGTARQQFGHGNAETIPEPVG